MEFEDYYDTLDVKRDASQDEIKRSYRKLARKYHPDISKETDAEARFKQVGEAYEVLKDPEKRAAYDQLGANWQAGQDFRPPPDWDQGFEHQGDGFSEAQFSDFFESLFGQRGHGGAQGAPGQRGFHTRGMDSHARVQIDLEDAYHGGQRVLTLKHSELNTEGRPALKERTLNVRIPKGVRQGQQIRLAKQGGTGVGEGNNGDLYLEIEFAASPALSRRRQGCLSRPAGNAMGSCSRRHHQDTYSGRCSRSEGASQFGLREQNATQGSRHSCTTAWRPLRGFAGGIATCR